jgi:hypothetical protein
MVGPLRYFMVTWLSFGVLDTVVESASTTVLTVTPICRVVGGDDMTGCGRAATVKTYHIAVGIIAQLSGHRVAKGSRFDRLDLLDVLGPVEVGVNMCCVMLHVTLDLFGT